MRRAESPSIFTLGLLSADIWMWFGEINHSNNAAVVQK